MADSREMKAGMIEAEIGRFIAEEQYSLAVILSQTMLELLVEREVRGLAENLDTGSSVAALEGRLDHWLPRRPLAVGALIAATLAAGVAIGGHGMLGAW